MRLIAILLILSSALLASEKVLLHTFQEASADAYSPAGKTRMQRAIEELGSKGGEASAKALAHFIRRSLTDVDAARTERVVIEKRGWKAHAGIKRLKKELDHLHHRESAGATDIGPQIAARQTRLVAMKKALDLAKRNTLRVMKLQDMMIKQRERAAIACASILRRLDPEQFANVLVTLRSTLDVDNRDESLLLVRMLRASQRKQAAAPLLDIFSHPKTIEGARIEAACAVAALSEGRSTRELIDRVRKDENFARARVMHALSLAARRKLKDLDAASEWAKTLK